MQTFKNIYVFLEGKGGRKSGRETSVCGHLSNSPHWGPSAQPIHVPDWESNQRPSGSKVSNPLSHTSQGNFKPF